MVPRVLRSPPDVIPCAFNSKHDIRNHAGGGAQEATKKVTKLADRGAQTTAALTEANQRVLNEFMGLRGSSRAAAATSATSRCRACCTRRSFAALTPTRGS